MSINILTPTVARLRKIIAVALTVIIVSPLRAQFSTAKPDMKEYKLKSQILNQERKITIYKPPVLAKYKDAVSPVLYVLDGELAAYYYCTMVNYLCERIPQCPPITVVGIENDSLSKIYGYRMKPDEDVINNYGYIFLILQCL